MYVVKIRKDNQLLNVRHYHHFENVVAAIADNTMFEDIPDDVIEEISDWSVPKIYYASRDEDEMADDFEFRYPCGIVVYAGKILYNDDCN